MLIEPQHESPFDKLIWLATHKLAEHFPNYHNVLLAGMFSYECETLACDALMDKKMGGCSFHRLDPEQQENIIGGIEELLLEDLDPDIWEFYKKKLDKGPRFGYLNDDLK